MKRITAVFLLLCLLPAVLPLGVSATETAETTQAPEEPAEVRASNQCGEDLTWSYDAGTLTISGSGEMDDYPDGDALWLEYKDSIETLVFTGGVTSVGECAFLDYDGLKKVDFGSAMHTIGYRAFKSCDGLTTFTLPDTFRKFGEECFFGCSSLREIRCLGPMPSFKSSCLWDCPVSVFYPTTNPWPAEYVTPLYQSYQGKLQIFMGDGIEEAAAAEPRPAETQPPETLPPETVPETTAAPTEPVTVPTVPATEPVTQATEVPVIATEEPHPETTEEAFPQVVPEAEEPGLGLNGVLVGTILIAGTLTLILIGALVFRRRSY